jgi:hypothetical protein
MIFKPGKNPADVTSYRPISLLPTISRGLEKLVLNKINQEATHKHGYQTTSLVFDKLTQQYNELTA